jgi:tetratricopeptide (TPR) repeat protein
MCCTAWRLRQFGQFGMRRNEYLRPGLCAGRSDRRSLQRSRSRDLRLRLRLPTMHDARPDLPDAELLRLSGPMPHRERAPDDLLGADGLALRLLARLRRRVKPRHAGPARLSSNTKRRPKRHRRVESGRGPHQRPLAPLPGDTERPDAGSSRQPDAEASTLPDLGTSTRGNNSSGPSIATDIVCLSRFERMRTPLRPLARGGDRDLKLAEYRWGICQNCPDAWGKCEPCSDETVLRLALEIAGQLVFEGDLKQRLVAAVDKKIAVSTHDQAPDETEHLKRRRQDALAQAQSLYQDALDHYVAALRLSSHPELRIPHRPLRDEVLVGLADLYYLRLNRSDLAAEHYQKLLGTSAETAIAIHARLMLGQILLARGDWLAAERELRKASQLGILTASDLSCRGTERSLDELSKQSAAAEALCATYKRTRALIKLGRTALVRKLLRDCVNCAQLECGVGSAAAIVRKACAAENERSYP